MPGGAIQSQIPALYRSSDPIYAKKPAGPLDAYGAAVNTQGNDYDSIMQGYKNQAALPNSQPISYSGSSDLTSALALLKNFSDTGGYSSDDINALRERAISPIRSVYANAQQDLSRQKALQGGYSPGYGAAITKMARDASGQISTATNNANAGIAQMVQSGKLAALSPYANLASSEAGRGLDVSEFNSNLANADKNRQLDILKSQQSLYGTNPALVSTFGNQALNSAQLNQNQSQFNTRTQQTNNLAKLTAAGRL